MSIIAKSVITYAMMGALMVSIGSNIERGCKEPQSTFIECVGFAAVWPLLAGMMVFSNHNFPCHQ